MLICKLKSIIIYLLIVSLYICFLFSSFCFSSQITDLINVTKYHNKGYKGQGVKCAIVDSDWRGWSHLRDKGIVKDNHAWASIENKQALKDSSSDSGHGTAMARAFHDVAPEAEIYLYDDTVGLQSDNFDIVLDYFRTEGISLVSHSLNSSSCDPFYRSFLTGNDALSLFLDHLGRSVTVCAIAGNCANYTSFFHLVKDSGSNNMLFPNGTQDLNIKILVKPPLDIVITRSGYQRVAANYQYVLTNTRTGVAIVAIEKKSDKLPRTYNSIEVKKGQANVGDILKLNIVRNIDTVNYLDIIIGNFSTNKFKLQNPAEMNNSSSISFPGASKKAITSGAILVSDYNKRDVISSVSGRGPIPQDVDASGNVVVPYTIKPDLCCPSENGATSPTAPYVAGALAVLASAGLCDLSKPEETKQYLLANHVIQMGGAPNNTFGYGRLFLDAKPKLPRLTPPVPEEEDIVLGPILYL
ncbi:MAG: S8 family serine peptidase [Endomicrobium sp.]|jgi:hypothetical protein|nr:S8 family serine peptidase [Endomicrobium sp.]